MNVIKEIGGTAMIEHNGKFHVVALYRDKGQVQSIVPNDCPRDGGRWYGGFSDHGMAYVSKGRTRANAMRWFRRLTD